MEEYDPSNDHHFQSALATICVADPDRSETIIREYFGFGSSRWDGWDQQFIDFIERYRNPGILYGTIGNGWYFLFCPVVDKGIWVFADETMKGKGFLSLTTILSLKEVAIQKGLLERKADEDD